MKTRLFAILFFIMQCSLSLFSQEMLRENAHNYSGQYLTAIDFPVGALGGSVIRMNGKAEREWWHIFNNFEERAGSGKVPNSFFAIRAEQAGTSVIRALQTSPVGDFTAMNSLVFQGEYPFGWYDFIDEALPVKVELEAYSFLIPMDLKNSAIPAAVFRFTVKNMAASTAQVSIMAAQQNAVGFTGYDNITGTNSRNCAGYGSNQNTIVSEPGRTFLKMSGTAGSMQLSGYEADMTSTASWASMASLYSDFSAEGQLTGNIEAVSPQAETTVDGALAKDFVLNAGEEKTITFVLSWHFPKGTFGRADIPLWYFPEGGNQYENWWTDASDVDNYVFTHFSDLDSKTRLYHNTLYSSNVPHNVLDRVSSNICVLKSPTSFWTKDGYFGLWESTSDQEVWFGNCKHVYHYAQGHARLFPELGRTLREQDLKSQLDNGLLPSRDGENLNALDGHLGTILGVYREHLLSGNNDFLTTSWGQTKKAMNYVIYNYDRKQDGMLSGIHANTLDGSTSGTSPWIGSMYLAALKASIKMAQTLNDKATVNTYNKILIRGLSNQDTLLWDNALGYYKEKSENLPNSQNMGEGVSIDMLLGQWWANQLNLGAIYPAERSRASLSKIFNLNKITDNGSNYNTHYRDFLGTGDTGWEMCKYTGKTPENSVHYYDEVMSGFEYAAAATMLQFGMLNEGLEMVDAIAGRYDGRLRAAGEVTLASNATVYGCGSPFGDDECGDFYGRALSSWSTLLALQGFIYDGSEQTIGFQPVWQPENHSSFFSASAGWGLFTQTQTDLVQTSMIDVEYGSVLIQNLILSVPDKKKVNEISILLDGIEQTISSEKQSGESVAINLETACMVNSGSNLTVSFDYNPGEASSVPYGPEAPAFLYTVSKDKTIILDWADNEESDFANKYFVYRSKNEGGPYDFLAQTSVSQFTDTTVFYDTAYYYVVTALDNDGLQTNYSNEASSIAYIITKEAYKFDFNTPNAVEGWTANDHVGGLIQTISANGVDGVLTSEQGVKDIDPRIINNSVLTLPNDYLFWDGLEMRLRQLDSDGNPQPFDPQGTIALFMIPEIYSPGEMNNKAYQMEFEDEGEWVNVYLDISHLNQKTISTIFIDPIGNVSGIGKNFEVDYIYLTGIVEQEQLPFAEMNIPGTVEFEDFDKGGKFIAYMDADNENKGGFYRESESVDIGKKSEGEYYVGWCEDEEWLEYTVNVDAFGIYNSRITYAADIITQKLIDDFESDLSYWTVTGNAFEVINCAGVIVTEIEGSSALTSLKGHCTGYTGAVQEDVTGTLTSPEIDLTANYMRFLIAGGNRPGETGIKLTVDGNVVYTATGHNSGILREVTWDITAYKGQKGIIEIFDNATGGWGHIHLDHIQMLGGPSEPGFENAEVHLSLNDKVEPIIIKLPSTGSEQNWDAFDVEMVLPKGQNLLKVSIVNVLGSLNLDKMEFSLKQAVIPGTGTGLLRELWTGELGGRSWFVASICSEPDSVIDYVWEDVSPGCGIGNDFWNARWTGQIESLFTEDYTFYLTAKHLAKLWINDELVIDGWNAAASGQTLSGTVSLVANQKVDIRVDFAKKSGDGMIKLEWESTNNPKEVVPQSQLYHIPVSTSVANIENALPGIYPNPASEQITVKTNGNSISSVKIYDLFGKTLLASKDPFVSNKIFDISSIPVGLYFIEANYDEKMFKMKFIKQ